MANAVGNCKKKIKSVFFQIIVLILNKSRTDIASRLFDFLVGIKPGIANNLARKLKIDLLLSLSSAGKHIRKYSIFGPEEAEGFLSKILKEPCFESIHTPVVWGVSKGGAITVRERGVFLFEFRDAEITPLSDFIRVGDNVYWDKINRFQLTKTIVLDRDLIYYDKEAGCAFLENRTKKVRLKIGFSLCGVHMTSWGHFIGNFLPKLASLAEIESRGELTIILPKNVDAHIKEMVTITALNYRVDKVLLVEDDEAVICDQLYYCSAPSFIADHADYIQPYDVHLSDWAVSNIHLIKSFPSFHSSESNAPSRLFIGRRGSRNLKNWEEVERYFIKHGFEIIFPHQLSFKEKISRFANATHICGPYSSGFANVIFCKPGTKVLAFANIARTMDCFLSDIADGDFNLSATFLVGDENLPAGLHQEYSIPLEKIKAALADTKYLNCAVI